MLISGCLCQYKETVMSLSNLRVGLRLGLGFALLLLLVLGMGLFAISRVNHVQESVHDLADNKLPGTQQLGDIDDSLNLMRRVELQLLLGGDEKSLQDETARITREWEQLGPRIDKYRKHVDGPAEQQAFEGLKSEIGHYRQVQTRMVDLVRAGKRDEALALLGGESAESFRSTAGWKAKLDEINDKDVEQSNLEATENYRDVLWGIGMMVSLAMALGALIAWVLTRSLTVPLGFAAATADRIADGDLSARVESIRGDELGDLLRALGRMQQALNQSVRTVKQSADSIANASAEVSSGGHDLSARTEQAAANLEQTSAAMQQVTETVQLSAESARQAHQLATTASGVAVRGGNAVSQVVNTMNGIQAASRKIGDITGVIDGIAFQTNILALNAAVEAARAGEHGRGFAVVASEVRTLAQRSAQAAREIKGLITASVEQVENGARQVGDAGHTMNEVVAAVQKVSGLIGEMSDSIQRQTQSLTEVNSAIGLLDGMTQKNAALVEESAAASESLRDQAARLTEVVARFKLMSSSVSLG